MATVGWIRTADGSYLNESAGIGIYRDMQNPGWILIRDRSGILARLDPAHILPSDLPNVPGIQELIQGIAAGSVPPPTAVPAPTQGSQDVPAAVASQAEGRAQGPIPQPLAPGQPGPPDQAQPAAALGPPTPTSPPSPAPSPTARATPDQSGVDQIPPWAQSLGGIFQGQSPAPAQPGYLEPGQTPFPNISYGPQRPPGQPTVSPTATPSPNLQAAGKTLGASKAALKPIAGAKEGTDYPGTIPGYPVNLAQQGAQEYTGDQQYGIAGGQYGPTTGSKLGWSILGYDPTTAYQQYLASQQIVQPGGLGAPIQILTDFSTWLNQAIQTMGTYGVAKILATQYEQATNKPVTKAQLDQILAISKTIPANAQAEIMQAAAAVVLDPSQQNSQALSTVINATSAYANWANQTIGPASTIQAAQKNQLDSFITTYTNTVGHPPNAQEIATYGHAPQQLQLEYIDSIPIFAGMNATEYKTVQNQMDQLYQAYYGRTATPDEIAWGSGKTEQGIYDHIMSGPSKVSGMALGTYLSVGDALNQISNSIYGHGAGDEMINTFTSSLNQLGEKPTFQYNPKGGA